MNSSSIGIDDIRGYFGRDDRQREFPRFCNSIILAGTARPLPTRPNFSDRPGPDGGFDGSWELPEKDPASANARPLALPGWNAFQFKARHPRTPVSALIRDVRGAVAKLIDRSGRPKQLRRYALFTNLDAGQAEEYSIAGRREKRKSQVAAIKEALCDGMPAGETAEVEVFDASFLSTAVNTHPAIRETFFGERIFQTWDESRRVVAENSLFPDLPLIGRDKEVKQLCEALTATGSDIRFVGVSGASGMGKTRLVVEATRELASETVVVRGAKKGAFLDRDLAAYMSGPLLIVVVDDLRASDAISLAKQLVLHERLRVIATIPAEEHLPEMRFDELPFVLPLRLPPLTSDAAEKLIRATGSKLSSRDMDWVVQEAGRNPQILLHAARMGCELRGRRGELKAKVADDILQRAHRDFGPDTVAILEALSPLSPFDSSSDAHLDAINRVFGLSVQLADVRRRKDQLIRSGLLEEHGRKRPQLTVSPPLLAAFLFERLLEGRPERCWQLFERLDMDGRHRLLDRLVSVDRADTLSLWSNLLGASGPFNAPADIEVNLSLLDHLAVAAPRQTAEFLRDRMDDLYALATRPFHRTSGDVIDAIAGVDSDYARNRALEEFCSGLRSLLRSLVYQVSSAGDALVVLERLALSDAHVPENERGRFAGLFTECFVPWFTDFPIHPRDRWEIVKRLLAAPVDSPEYVLGCGTVFAITAPPHSLSGYSPRRQRHEDIEHRLLLRDLWDYQSNALEKHFKLAARNGSARGEARRLVPQILSEAVQRLPVERSVPVLEGACKRFFSGKLGCTASRLRLVLQKARELLHELLPQYAETDFGKELPGYISRVETLIGRIESGSLHHRLELWISRSHTRGCDVDPSTGTPQYLAAFTEIAKAFLSRPRRFTPVVVEVLTSDEAARAGEFCEIIGREDRGKTLWNAFHRLRDRPRGDRLFTAYCRGIRVHDPSTVEQYLDRIVESPEEAAHALANIGSIGPTPSNRKRLKKLLRNWRVTHLQVATELGGMWLAGLPLAEAVVVFRFVDHGDKAEGTEWVLELASSYLYRKRRLPPAVSALAQRSLLRPVKRSAGTDYNRD